jgi:asparagine synthase (glutamine-hydrolysing)
MCGISGYIGTFNEHDMQSSAQSIAHRGPDAFSVYRNGDVTLAHHRLSIIDLSESANQPFHFEHLTLVYNGELYNFSEVREDLIKLGYTFNTSSDTEVLIKAFHKWGKDCISRFIGMFAFAMYDRFDNSIYLCRDRVGVKPLFYSLERGLVFGSEMRVIIPMLKDKEPDHNSIYEYFRLGYISRNKTIFKNAKKLLPGHYLHYKDGKASITPFWKAEDALRHSIPDRSAEEWEEELHTLMIDAFSKRMIADVPVGIFLSGGVDSSLVASILQKNYGNIHTFTIGFDDDRYNEAHIAKGIAAHLGTNHTEFTLNMTEAHETLENFYDIYGEPFADSSGIPTTIVSRLAAQEGIKVVLSGDGGDELFCGYSRFTEAPALYNKVKQVPYFIRNTFGSVAEGMKSSGILNSFYNGNIEHKASAGAELLSSKQLGEFYTAFIANQSHSEMRAMLKNVPGKTNTHLISEDVDGLMFYDMQHYLPDDLLVKMDCATMHHSIEGREPFLDHRIIELALQIPQRYKCRDGQTKWILRNILRKYVPDELHNKRKMGFSIPIFKWFSEYMDSLFEHYLTQERLDKTGIFNTAEVLREYKKYKWNKKHNKEYNIEKMWRILSFLMWWNKWYEKL